MTKTFTLSRPVQDADDSTVTQLVFREPTGGDLLEVGMMPFTIDANNHVEISVTAVGPLMARLANVSPVVIRSLAARDFVTASLVIMSFFNDAAQETFSIAATSSPASSTAA